MGSVIHQTVPVQVWADIDVGIADLVRYLNTISGVRTHTSCQGTVGELSDDDKAAGAQESRPWVMVSWDDDATLALLETKFDIDVDGDHWGHLHPRETTK